MAQVSSADVCLPGSALADVGLGDASEILGCMPRPVLVCLTSIIGKSLGCIDSPFVSNYSGTEITVIFLCSK